MSKRSLRLVGLLAAAAVVASACGGGDGGSTEVSGPPEEPTEAPAPDEVEGDDGAGAAVGTDLVVGDGWDLQRIGTGIKPALALDPAGNAALAFLTEAIDGTVSFASAANGWAIETVAAGYFYGPIDLAFGPTGDPAIVYHDHQGETFDPLKGDLVLARPDGDTWSQLASGDDGHDGWDSTLVFGPDGQVWAAGIEPADFGTTEGVEFYELNGDALTAESIGSPPITYEFNVSLAVGAEGEPVLTYYDDSADQLRIATRTADGWLDEAVNEPGGGGMFSSLVINPDGTRHVTYYAQNDATSGEVFYAADDGSGWQIESVAPLADVVLGMTGARRITSLQFASDGSPLVALTDRSAVWIASRGDSGWTTEQVITAGAQPLGQQVQLVVADGTLHLTTFEATNAAPLEGEILYLSRAG